MDIDYPPYAYQDSTTGELTGMGKDIADGMTAATSAQCAGITITVVQTSWSDCWTSAGLGTKLDDGTLDACMTYTHTKGQRDEVADFSDAFLNDNKAAGLLTKLDANGNPMVTGYDDLSGLKVVDVGGWAPTADGLGYVENKCTSSGYADSSTFTLQVAEGATNNNELALSMVLDGTSDVAFIYSDQAYQYQTACTTNATTTWTCSTWNGFGTTYAYVQTGQFGHVHAGTTLAMSKKGSGIVGQLNPCLVEFMATSDYYDLCVKYDLVDTCHANTFFPGGSAATTEVYDLPTSSQSGDCSNGYCPCTRETSTTTRTTTTVTAEPLESGVASSAVRAAAKMMAIGIVALSATYSASEIVQS
jgi:hypothetical protein